MVFTLKVNILTCNNKIHRMLGKILPAKKRTIAGLKSNKVKKEATS